MESTVNKRSTNVNKENLLVKRRRMEEIRRKRRLVIEVSEEQITQKTSSFTVSYIRGFSYY